MSHRPRGQPAKPKARLGEKRNGCEEDAADDDDQPVELPIEKPRNRNRNQQQQQQQQPVVERPRDPRFDPKCGGSGDPRHFIRNYAFLEEVRAKELGQLQAALKRERNPQKRDQIKMTIGRYRNKLIDLKRKAEPKARRCDKKAKLVEQFKELKQSGKLTKYLERKRKKLIKRDSRALA